MANTTSIGRAKGFFIGLSYTIFCIGLIAFLAFIANFFLKGYGWAISIGIANLVFLIILNLLPIEQLVGTSIIKEYWAKAKEESLDLILANCTVVEVNPTENERDKKVILTGCVKNIFRVELETVTKSAFLIKDTKGFVAGFKTSVLEFILGCTFLLFISYFGNIDFLGSYQANPAWNKDAVKTIEKLKTTVEVTVLISSVIAQLAFLLRTPFLLELRNRAYIVENNFNED